MRNLRPLTAREARQIMDLVHEQYGCDVDLDYYFIAHERDRSIFLLSRDVATVDLESLRVNSLGSYFCEPNDDQTIVRLSIEGSQLIGPHAKRNIITLNDEDFKEWIKGIPLSISADIEAQLADTTGYVIVRNAQGDYFGVARAKNAQLLNFTPKNRRIAMDA